MKYKKSIVKFSYKYGVTKAAIKFGECRRTIYRWRKRYDGNLESLKDKSRKPHYHPNQHTIEEIKLIKQYKANNKNTGLVVLWVKLRRARYTRTIQGLYHAMRRMGIYKKAPSKKKEKQPMEWKSGTYPGEKVQIDVKYVPQECLTKELKDKGEKFYQYTAIDEFTNRLNWNSFSKNKKTMFEETLKKLGIKHKLIKLHTPKENGRVERSNRKDQEQFYYGKIFLA